MKVAAGIITIVTYGLVSAAMAQDWLLARVADSNTPVPGEGGTFTASGSPFAAPSLGSDGRVGVWGRYNTGSRDAIFSNGSGTLGVIANRTTVVPGGSLPFSSFALDVSYDGNSVAFGGGDSAGHSGVFAYRAGQFKTIVNEQTTVPGGSGVFSTFGAPSIEGVNAVFGGQSGPSGNNAGIYRWADGAGLGVVVDQATPAPGGLGTFSAVSPATLSGNFVAFSGVANNRLGIFGRDLLAQQPAERIADTSTLVPGGSGTFAGFNVGIVGASGSNVAFIASDDQLRRGVYARLNGQLVNVADTLHPGPGGIHFTDFLSVSVSGDNIAFVSTTQGVGNELWVVRGGQFTRVLSTNTVLNGITVAGILLGSEGLKGDTIAFSFLDNGIGVTPTKGGVYTATYIPTPGAAFVVGLAGLFAVRQRRTRPDRQPRT